MTKLELPQNPTLTDFQDYAQKMVVERGFEKETTPEMFMLLLEECGELAKAARKSSGMKIDATSEQFALSHEFADVFMYLLCIANRFHVNLEIAFRAKETLNKQRTWN